MEKILAILREPWPWYVAGPMIGLTVPFLLLLGNKAFGISSSLRHLCAMCLPARIPFFDYNWQREAWNLFFVLGIFLGAIVASSFLFSGEPVTIHPTLQSSLKAQGVSDFSSLVPADLFSFETLFSLKGFILMVVGGFLVGFGTRYAGGCTSGHSITGISMLQPGSVVATMCFMAGGIIVANFVLPWVLSL